ncbi:MAG TPA: sugar ABC transporter permease [Candidatus Limnocylindrales bacterium]|nr:sugar ABC transporter permease [Candidatus Limnocylindrales bacterium]
MTVLIRHRWAYLFIAPFFILFAIFFVFPIAFSLWLSLNEWRGTGPMRFVGLQNYMALLRDGTFWNSMANAAVLFLLYVPIMTALAVLLAAALNDRFIRLRGFWKAVIFLPYITSMVAVGFTFRLIFDTHSGIVNDVLGIVGLGPVPWLDDPWGAKVTLAILITWAWLGYNTVIMLAGLQTIPSEVVEAARVDGASRLQALRHVTVPLLKPVILFSLTLSVIGTFSLFTEPSILTRGGPARATTMPVMEIFSTTFSNLRFGYAAAMSYVVFAVIIIATAIQFRVARRGNS